MKKYILIIFTLLGTIASLFIMSSQSASASSSCQGIIISEIMPNPALPLSDSIYEWTELKNTTVVDLDISGCKIKDMKGLVKEYVIPSGTVISANGFLVFYSRDTKISLNNDTDGMTFLDSTGTLISQTALYKNAPDGQSFVLNGSTWEWTADVTPGFEKINDGSGAPADGGNTCEGLIISELMPDPVSPLTDTTDEWIEIYNESGDPVNAGGCILTDTQKPGSTHEYKIVGGMLAPGGFMVFYSKNTKISLNNDGDSVRVLSSDKKVIFETQNYGKAEAGQSFAYDGSKWAWTVAMTPGALNVIEIAEDSSAAKASSKKAAASKSKSAAVKAKTKSKPVSKSSSTKKKTADGAGVLGANTEDEATENAKKINDKMMGYILVGLSAVLLVGYIVWINKDFIYENSIKKFRRNS